VADYPRTPLVGELETLVGKEQWLALTVDLIHEMYGEDLPDDELQAKIAARLDILHHNGLVPRTLPKRVRRG
jgi:hypothetical protein